MISVVDFGVGNLGSIMNMLRYVGAPATFARTSKEVREAKALLLPGVGHFGHAMAALQERDLVGALKETAALPHVPVLGICLGMQLLGAYSEEGDVPGLGLIDADFRLIEVNKDQGTRVPHMGWNTIRVVRENPLLEADRDMRFYFVHSYKAYCRQQSDVIATCDYGEEFCCAYGQGNVMGVQFHPEKSHRYGIELFRRFAQLVC